MANVTDDMDAEHVQSLGRRYLIRFEEDTLRQRPAEGGDLPLHGSPSGNGR